MNQRARNTGWLGTSLALICFGCGDSGSGGGTPPPSAEIEKPVVVTEPTEPEPTEPAAPAAASGGATATADAAAGGATYATYCATCHGATGDGDTPIAQVLDPPPTAHSNGEYMNGLADVYLFQLVKEGGASVGKSPNMAPWGGSLSDQQIRDVIAHIRTLAVPPYQAPTP